MSGGRSMADEMYGNHGGRMSGNMNRNMGGGGGGSSFGNMGGGMNRNMGGDMGSGYTDEQERSNPSGQLSNLVGRLRNVQQHGDRGNTYEDSVFAVSSQS